MKINKALDKLNYFFVYLIFLAILFFVNYPVVAQIKMLRMGSDEYNILAIAAYFSGTDWSSYSASINAYHGFGGAVFYMPLFWIFDDAVLIYKLSLVINIFVLAIVPVISYYIMTHFWKIENIKALMVSICISLYPYYLVSNKHTWSENSVILVTWLNLLLVLKVFEKANTDKAFWWQALYALVAGYSYMVHGRCIIYVVTAPLLILLANGYAKREKILNSKKICQLAVLLLILAGFYIINSSVINLLKDNLWKASELRNTMSSLAGNRIAYLFDIKSIITMCKMAFGQFFYIFIATLGIAFMAFVLMGQDLITSIKSKSMQNRSIYTYTAVYMFVVYLGSLAISILGLISGVTSGKQRRDYIIWGRHTEPLLPVLIMLVFVYFLTKKITKKHIRYFLLCIAFVIIGFVRLALPLYTGMTSSGHSSIVSILFWFRWDFLFFGEQEAVTRVIYISLLMLIISITFVLLLKKKKVTIVCLLIAVQSIASFAYVSKEVTIKTADDAWARVEGLSSFLNTYDIKPETVYYLSAKDRYPSEMQIVLGNSKLTLLYDPLEASNVYWERLTNRDSLLIIDTSHFTNLCKKQQFDSDIYDEAKYIEIDGNKTLIFLDKAYIEEVEKKGVILIPLKEELDIQKDIATIGRTYLKDGMLYFNWTNSGFTFNFNGEGSVKALMHSDNLYDDPNHNAYVVVYVDGERKADIELSEQEMEVVLAKKLKEGEHTIRVVKRTNGRSSTAAVSKVVLDTGSTVLPPNVEENNPRKIQFVGDSIMVGMGSLSEKEDKDYSTKTEDGTVTYTALAAEYFGAENHTIAISGRGIVANNNNSDPEMIAPFMYEYTDWNNVILWDHKNYEPNVVVINYGTNDKQANVSNEDFVEGVKVFIEQVRSANPSSAIIYSYGFMGDSYETQIEQVINMFNENGDSNIFYLHLKPVTFSEKGLAGHPTAEAHAKRAEVLIEKIKEVTGWE